MNLRGPEEKGQGVIVVEAPDAVRPGRLQAVSPLGAEKEKGPGAREEDRGKFETQGIEKKLGRNSAQKDKGEELAGCL